MDAILLVAVLVFAAELGDKSQLVALSFATRFPARSVLLGLLIATAAMQALSVTVGTAVAAVVPERLVALGGGLLFIVFGLLTLQNRTDGVVAGLPSTPARGAVPTVAGAFVAAELGDKTMLASATLAATHGPVVTWIGATGGMFAAAALAVGVGGQLAERVRPEVIRLFAAAGFFAVGLVLVVGALRG